ncbi:SRPBCC family protein [Spirillospora sp. NBC_01491]|uniref:SRPBCC family protein n=1 Tax=Spirillospora sp. NBC_01491 TaxID=2976007 RepID=UPI002E35D68B|nr:SRPBCC domain-containing protein [Spirillospora sp. NBC_01491]
MRATPQALYTEWTERFDQWFAAPGTLSMIAAVNAPFFFQVEADGELHSHYGRFLKLDPARLIELTWITGAGGTDGAETVVTIDLTPAGSGSALRLTHAGFSDQAARDRHDEAWPQVLANLDEHTAAG